MGRPRKKLRALDLDLEDLPAPARWREWMTRVEGVIFASAEPVSREALARVVGVDCKLDLIVADIRAELKGRPYDIVAVAGGWQFRTKLALGEAIRTALGGPQTPALSPHAALVLMAVAYFQPITRFQISNMVGREVSRDTMADLRSEGLIGEGPRSPKTGAAYTYVTTPGYLARFGFKSLRDLPDIERLEEAGLIGGENKARSSGSVPAAAELSAVLGIADEEEDAA